MIIFHFDNEKMSIFHFDNEKLSINYNKTQYFLYVLLKNYYYYININILL